MEIYIECFFIVMILAILSQITIKNKWISVFFSLLSIVVLSLVAACRADTVGIDISVYGIRYFYKAKIFKDFFGYLQFYNFREPLYFGLNYLVYILFGDVHFLWFAMQLFLSSITFIIAYRKENRENFWLYIFTYIMIWFNTSFNIMRQSLAIFVILYCFKFIEQQKFIKYYIGVFVAFLFHSSAVLAFFIPIIYLASKSKYKYIILGISSLALTVFFWRMKDIVYVLSLFIKSLDKYYVYASSEQGNIIIKYAIFKFMFLVLILSFTKFTREQNIGFTLVFIAVLDFLLYCSSAFIMYGYRMFYFFLVHYIYLIPKIDRDLKGHRGRIAYRIGVILLLSFYWYYRFVKVGYDGTVPYKFYWNV